MPLELARARGSWGRGRNREIDKGERKGGADLGIRNMNPGAKSPKARAVATLARSWSPPSPSVFSYPFIDWGGRVNYCGKLRLRPCPVLRPHPQEPPDVISDWKILLSPEKDLPVNTSSVWKHFRETVRSQAFPLPHLRLDLRFSNAEGMARWVWVVPWSRRTVSSKQEKNNIMILLIDTKKIAWSIAISIHDGKTQAFSKFRTQMGSWSRWKASSGSAANMVLGGRLLGMSQVRSVRGSLTVLKYCWYNSKAIEGKRRVELERGKNEAVFHIWCHPCKRKKGMEQTLRTY